MGPPGDGGASHEIVVNIELKLQYFALCEHILSGRMWCCLAVMPNTHIRGYNPQRAKCSRADTHGPLRSIACGADLQHVTYRIAHIVAIPR